MFPSYGLASAVEAVSAIRQLTLENKKLKVEAAYPSGPASPLAFVNPTPLFPGEPHNIDSISQEEVDEYALVAIPLKPLIKNPDWMDQLASIKEMLQGFADLEKSRGYS